MMYDEITCLQLQDEVTVRSPSSSYVMTALALLEVRYKGTMVSDMDRESLSGKFYESYTVTTN